MTLVDLEAVELLAAAAEPECTPWGRVAALDQDTYLTLREIADLLTGGASGTPERYRELGEQLVLLHDKNREAYEAVIALRWGW